MSTYINPAILKHFTKAQQALAKKHGTPADFAKAVYQAVPDHLSMDQASKAVEKYNQEWSEAGTESDL